MLIQCDNCGKFIDSNNLRCPHCGVMNNESTNVNAPKSVFPEKQKEDVDLRRKYLNNNNNNNEKNDTNDNDTGFTHESETSSYTPKTIEEFKTWYEQSGYPSQEVTRFYIGKNVDWARAFGIYKEESTGEFIVYKNKADGTRAVRYRGPDEAFAVKEIYDRFMQEVQNQNYGAFSGIESNRTGSNVFRDVAVGGAAYTVDDVNRETDFTTDRFRDLGRSRLKRSFGTAKQWLAAAIVFVFLLFGGSFLRFVIPRDGYYLYNNKYYYHLDSKWYSYSGSSWGYVSAPEELTKNYNDYYLSSIYSRGYNITNFKDTSYYIKYTREKEEEDYQRQRRQERSRSSIWDSDSSTSSSWDSDSTDWDSDW